MSLLEITTNDIKLDVQVQRARLDYRQELPTHTVKKSGGNLTINTSRPQMRADSYERRASMGFRGIASQTTYMKQTGRQAAMEATANYADTGNALRDIQKGANIPDAYYGKNLDTGSLGFQPLAPVDISWEEGFIRQQFETARVAFDWKTSQDNSAQFTPGTIKFSVSQYPSIEFNFTGGPIYVPKSADPNYSKAI